MSREQHSARLMQEAPEAGGKSDVILSYFLEGIGPEESAQLRAVLRQLRRQTTRR